MLLKGEHDRWMVSVGGLSKRLRHWTKKSGIYLKEGAGGWGGQGEGPHSTQPGDMGAMLAAPRSWSVILIRSRRRETVRGCGAELGLGADGMQVCTQVPSGPFPVLVCLPPGVRGVFPCLCSHLVGSKCPIRPNTLNLLCALDER